MERTIRSWEKKTERTNLMDAGAIISIFSVLCIIVVLVAIFPLNLLPYQRWWRRLVGGVWYQCSTYDLSDCNIYWTRKLGVDNRVLAVELRGMDVTKLHRCGMI